MVMNVIVGALFIGTLVGKIVYFNHFSKTHHK